jgi:hypothetical protein
VLSRSNRHSFFIFVVLLTHVSMSQSPLCPEAQTTSLNLTHRSVLSTISSIVDQRFFVPNCPQVDDATSMILARTLQCIIHILQFVRAAQVSLPKPTQLVSTSSPLFVEPSTATSIESKMGLGASIDVAQQPKMGQVGNCRPLEPKVRKRMNKNEDASAKEEWRKRSEAFASDVLDPCYVHSPVPPSTVEAASQYPSDFPDYPGLLPGTHKHLGGAYDANDGTIYGIPANSKAILCIHPNPSSGGRYELSTIPLPERVTDCNMKWLRGIISGGYLWAIPAWADCVLCVDIDAFWGRRELPDGQTAFVRLIPLPESHPVGMRWQWHGAGINKEETAIYCIPSNANQVLKVDVIAKSSTFIDIQFDQDKYTDFSLDCTNKWYGGIVGDDNCIYGIPYRAPGVLRIDSMTDTATLIGPNYGIGKYFWHGGIKRLGKIYAHPSHAETVLVIDTREDKRGSISELPIHRADYDKDDRKNYKWLGGSLGADGNIYCPACDTSAILKIHVETGHCETLGFTGTDKNKWQGGILGRDNCIYCIPANGIHVCRIATDPSVAGENPVQLLGDLPAHKDKWQGAARGKDGSLYFIPENGYRVMRVTPPPEVPKVVEGKLPENDVLIELM